jgi:hypothetical protein
MDISKINIMEIYQLQKASFNNQLEKLRGIKKQEKTSYSKNISNIHNDENPNYPIDTIPNYNSDYENGKYKAKTFSIEGEDGSIVDNPQKFYGLEGQETISKEILKKKKNETPILSKLSQTIGMIGRKLDLDKIKEMNYQYWDCVTKKDSYLIRKSSDFDNRKTLIDFCKTSFLKAYPTNLNSMNYDCIKTWITGCQISAINIQMLECENFLLNLIFFKQNKNFGLVLKPKKLRSSSNEYNEKYLSYKKKLKITLISGYMLNLLGYENENNEFTINIKKLRLVIKLVGSCQDDLQKNNYFEILIEQNLFNPHFLNIVHTLEIFEEDLSALFIYIYSDKHIIGRSVIPLCMLAEGIRCIPIYDKKADEFSESRLVFKFDFCN